MSQLLLLAQEQPTWFVVVLGVGTVFVGLVCLIILCKLLSAACSIGNKKENTQSAPAAVPAKAESGEIPNRQEFVAAVSAAIAENLGKDVSAIKILSIKKM